MTIHIRKSTEADVPAMLALIQELAAYEKEPEAVIANESTMLRFGFGEEKIFDSVVAEADGLVAGTAIFYRAYSTWKGKMIYLDDIIVTERYRRFGIGKMLFDSLIAFAKVEGASQLRWHVLNWNTPAIAFYKKYNASLDSGWITCKLEKGMLDTL